MNPNQVLFNLVSSLVNLEYLDISGTNLCGTGVAQRETSNKPDDETSAVACDIPGLKSRVNNPLQFLGLYNAHHEACYRHHIPALKVSSHPLTPWVVEHKNFRHAI